MADDLVDAIRAASDRLGINPSDLATAISYETGGKFSPSVWGGKGGQYLGLIQFSPENQRKYGVAPNQSATEQMQAVESYLRDRGVKPGMGMLDLYSTINAGRPGLYNRSDAAAGGMPGTVADKVATQMVGHRMRANQLLASAGVAAPTEASAVSTSPAVSSPAPATAIAAAQAPAAEPNITASPDAPAGPSLGGDTVAQMQAVLKMLAAQDQESALPPPPPITYPVPQAVARARAMAAAMQRGGGVA